MTASIALITLAFLHKESWLATHHPEIYNPAKEVVKELRLKDVRFVYDVYDNEKITYTWRF